MQLIFVKLESFFVNTFVKVFGEKTSSITIKTTISDLATTYWWNIYPQTI